MHVRTEQSVFLMTVRGSCVCGVGEPLLPLVKVKVVPLLSGGGASGGGSLQVTFLESEVAW